MQGQMGPLLAQLDALKPRVQALVKKRETRSRGEGLMAMITKEEARLDRLQNRGVWRANNNINTQYAAQYGKDRHAAEWSSRSCQVPVSRDGYAIFPGGTHDKPDCIIARSGQCEIWEFKPDSPTGRRDGLAQAADYARAVPAYYTNLLRRDEAPDSLHGGAAFMAELKKYCFDKDDNEIVFTKSDVFYYTMCEKQYVCEQ
jgi:hypothetical protein